MFGLTQAQLLGFLRHLVTFIGGILVAKGQLDPTQLESIAGALVTLIGAILSFTSPEKITPANPTKPETAEDPGGGPITPTVGPAQGSNTSPKG